MTMPGADRQFETRQEIGAFVRQFESCALPPVRWNHRARLAITCWYRLRLGEAAATERLLARCRRYTREHALRLHRYDSYHETLTLFWLAVAGTFVSAHDAGDLLDVVNHFVERFGDKEELFREYFSREHISSWAARDHWVEPDLRSLGDAGRLRLVVRAKSR